MAAAAVQVQRDKERIVDEIQAGLEQLEQVEGSLLAAYADHAAALDAQHEEFAKQVQRAAGGRARSAFVYQRIPKIHVSLAKTRVVWPLQPSSSRVHTYAPRTSTVHGSTVRTYRYSCSKFYKIVPTIFRSTSSS